MRSRLNRMHAAVSPGCALQYQDHMLVYGRLSSADAYSGKDPCPATPGRVHFISRFDASYAVHYHDYASILSSLPEDEAQLARQVFPEDGICSLVAVADSDFGVGLACDGPGCSTTFSLGDLFLAFPVPVVGSSRRPSEVKFKLSCGNGRDLHLGGFPSLGRAGGGPGVADAKSQQARCGSSHVPPTLQLASSQKLSVPAFVCLAWLVLRSHVSPWCRLALLSYL